MIDLEKVFSTPEWGEITGFIIGDASNIPDDDNYFDEDFESDIADQKSPEHKIMPDGSVVCSICNVVLSASTE